MTALAHGAGGAEGAGSCCVGFDMGMADTIGTSPMGTSGGGGASKGST